MLKNSSILVRCIHQAYPNWEPRPQKLVSQLKEAKKEYKLAVKEYRKDVNFIQNKWQIKQNIFTTESIGDRLKIQ